MSGQQQTKITQEKLNALAKANGISPKTEAPSILTELERQKLILRGPDQLEVLGLTGLSILEHTSTIFDESDHEVYEDAIIEVSEIASESPVTDRNATEYLSDIYQLSASEVNNTLQLGETIGFFDSEKISSTEKLFFPLIFLEHLFCHGNPHLQIRPIKFF